MSNPKSSLDAQDQLLITTQLARVKVIASGLARKLPASVDRNDLVQDGLVGLMDALLRWTRTSTGAHFQNYMAQRAEGAMLDGLRALDPGSRQVRKQMRQVERAIQQLEHQLGRTPRPREIAAAMDMPVDKYLQLLQDAHGYMLISLHDLAGDDAQSFLQHCAEKQTDPLAVLERGALKTALAHAVAQLPKQMQKVLQMYYIQDMKMLEIARQLHLTEARISQLHTQAIALLRANMPEGDITRLLQPRRTPRSAPVVSH
jgi:RNA polymerase sigma factor for flagellar operon FliA